MPDSLPQLIGDTLNYLKDPLLQKHTLFATQEEELFFQKTTSRSSIENTKPALPSTQSPPYSRLSASKYPLPKQTRTENVNKAEQQVKETSTGEDKPPLPHAAPIAKESNPPSEDAAIKKTLLRAAPSLRLVDQIPDDAPARRVANSWKEKILDAEVVLLACQTDRETLEFLKSLGKAIDKNLAKAKILPAETLEKENRWELFLQRNQLRLIVASEGAQKLPQLMRFYRELPATSQYYLDKTPLLPLSSASAYKALEQKALLWKSLCQMLKT
jgi:hypothetical protein